MKKYLFFLPLLAAFLSLNAEEAGVHRFANYNVRYVNPKNGDTGEKFWANRRQYVVRIITDYDFDIVGMEEVTGNNRDDVTGKSQLQDLRDMLTDYADHAVEREGRDYEYNVIFYKKNKYTLLDKGHFYLNEHPETPGEGWNTKIARSCAYVHLRDNASGTDFYFVCTHVNFGSSPAGMESGKLIGHRIRQLVGQTPVVMVGDFNMIRASHEEAYRGYASHFYDLALTAPLNQCLPADGPQIAMTTTEWTPANQATSGAEYDYIWYDHMEPLSRHIITQYYPGEGRTINPSDHYSVLGRFRLPSGSHTTRFYATDVASLQTALAQVTMEDTIFLAAGDYTLTSPIVPTCSMTLSGGWNAGFTAQPDTSTINAVGLTEPVFNIPHYYNLELDHISVRGGNVTSLGGGGAIYSNGSELSLQNCRFISNSSTSSGGAVVHKGDSLFIRGCVFSSNSAANGGAVWCQLRNKILVHDSRFFSNTASAAGSAIEALAFDVLDIQRCAFVGNMSVTHGAVDIAPAEAPTAAHILNCSFLDNTLDAKKGMASVTKRYGGAGLWADMTANTIPLNIGLCTFMGNHIYFNGTAGNIGGAAVAIYKGKVCLMDNILLANDQLVDGNAPVWSDLYAVINDVNIWRDTYNLRSSSSDISGWEDSIATTFGGSLANGQYQPYVNDNGAYPFYQRTLASYNLACLLSNQRLCESAFTYDLDGNGAIDGYVKRDMLNHQRNIRSCIGAVEYTETESQDVLKPFTEDHSPATTKVIRDGHLLLIRHNNTYDILGRIIQ